MKWLLAILILAVYMLHQDYWFWGNRDLVFGFLPTGMAYHAAYCVLAACLMAILVRYAWPHHLEDIESEIAEADLAEAHA